jgi:hypothetical protein
MGTNPVPGPSRQSWFVRLRDRLANAAIASSSLDWTTLEWWQKALTVLKRVVTLSALALAIYVFVGCWIFPVWWYEWLWKGEFQNADYYLQALQILLDHFFWLVLIIIGGILVASLLGRIFKKQLFRFVDAFGGLIVFVLLLGLATTFIFLYHEHHWTGTDVWSEMEKVNEGTRNALDGLNIIYFPGIQTPIDFDYIDRERVDALYNQIEPELVEKERTISDNAASQSKLGVGGAGISAETQRGKTSTSTSSLSRPQFTQERECIEVMRYLVKTRGAKAYTTSDSWMYVHQAAENIANLQSQQLSAALARFRAELGLEPLPPISKVPSTDDDRQRGLRTELRSLQGLIFLDNVFERLGSTTDLSLVGKFSTKPSAVTFRAHIPKTGKADLPKHGRLRVFGDVVRPLEEDGYIDVRAIAVF